VWGVLLPLLLLLPYFAYYDYCYYHYYYYYALLASCIPLLSSCLLCLSSCLAVNSCWSTPRCQGRRTMTSVTYQTWRTTPKPKEGTQGHMCPE
jgi:hypothetical protein